MMNKMLGSVSRTALAACALLVPRAAYGLGNGIEALSGGIVSPAGDVQFKPTLKLPIRVSNNAELKAFHYNGVVHRNGFYAAGDGGDAVYTHSSAACTQNLGMGDDGAQVTDGRGGCWLADLSKPISAAVWGVKANSFVDGSGTDSQPGMLAAVRALQINGGGTLIVPTGAGGACVKLGSTLPVFGSNIFIQGQSPLATCFDIAFAAGNGIEIGGNPTNNGAGATTLYNPFFDSVERVAFRHSVVHTSGADVSVYNAHYSKVSYVQCKGNGASPSGPKYYRCVDVDGGPNDARAAGTLDTYFEYISTSGYGQTGICVGCNGAFSSPISTDIRWAELDNNLGAAFEGQNFGGIYVETMNTDFNYIGGWIHPSTGQHANGIYAVNINFDASGQKGFWIDTSGGGVSTGHKFANLWVVNAGQVTPTQVPGAGPSPAFVMTGGTINPVYDATNNKNAGSISNIEITGLHSFGTNQNCIVMDAAVVDLKMGGQVSSCSQGNPNVYDAIRSVGAQHWSYDGEIGNNSLELANSGILPQSQRYAVSLEGATDYVKLSGDFTRNTSGPIIDNSTGTKTFTFDGVLPALPWIATTPAITCGQGAAGSGASAGMRYQVIGKTVRYTTQINMGTSSTCVGMKFTIPFAPIYTEAHGGGETTVSSTVGGFGGIGAWAWLNAGSTTAVTQSYNGGATGGNGASGANYVFTGDYERQ